MEASPDHTNFVYVPFNEPDGEVYGSYDKGITNLAVLESAWKTIYQTIRTINPSAEIAGPNFFLYDNSAYTNFMTYAKSNDVLPNEVTWHEFESSLGISPIKVVIDEYAQSAELGVRAPWFNILPASRTARCMDALHIGRRRGTFNIWAPPVRRMWPRVRGGSISGTARWRAIPSKGRRPARLRRVGKA